MVTDVWSSVFISTHEPSIIFPSPLQFSRGLTGQLCGHLVANQAQLTTLSQHVNIPMSRLSQKRATEKVWNLQDGLLNQNAKITRLGSLLFWQHYGKIHKSQILPKETKITSLKSLAKERTFLWEEQWDITLESCNSWLVSDMSNPKRSFLCHFPSS